MPVRSATAHWNGRIGSGDGEVSVESGTFEGVHYSAATRFEDEAGTNPDELLAASHVSCYTLALSAIMTQEGYEPGDIDATADVTIEEVDDSWTITTIDIEVEASVPDLDDGEFQEYAQAAKENCPVSKALAGVETITVDATLA